MKIITSLAAVIIAMTAFHAEARGSHGVRGYTKKNGTVVAPHHATNRDNSKSNNWSHKGNVNPYTGKRGTKE
jgi:hypothetical protein